MDTDTDSDCEGTPDNIEGPFWREDVPIRNDLDLYGHEGLSLTISGTVKDLDCNALPGAIVEIWHAYPSTVAVEDLESGDSVDYDHTSEEMEYRGQMATDDKGQYSFHTLKPGWYLNGSTFRPAHIHVKIWVQGTERLTTQLYFEGDPLIDTDPWAKTALEVSLSEGSDGAMSGTFDFVVNAT